MAKLYVQVISIFIFRVDVTASGYFTYRSDSVMSHKVSQESKPSEMNASRYWERPNRSKLSLRSVMKKRLRGAAYLKRKHGRKVWYSRAKGRLSISTFPV